MTTAPTIAAAEAARLPIMLTELRLPTIKRAWMELAQQSNREGWPAERFLGVLLEQEMNERETRRLARARADSHLPPDKSLADFDFTAVPAVSKAHVSALAEADGRANTCLAGGIWQVARALRAQHPDSPCSLVQCSAVLGLQRHLYPLTTPVLLVIINIMFFVL